MQKIVCIGSLEFERQQNWSSGTFELWWKNVSEMAPKIIVNQ